MAQDNAPNKPVHLMYLFGGVLLFYILKWTTDWIVGYFTRAPSDLVVTGVSLVVSLGAGIALYRHERTYTLINEITSELKKVTWPTAKEVRAATIVVIIMTIISAIILGIFDAVWSKLTATLYGG